MGTNDHDRSDDVVELPGPSSHAPGERAVATAVRRALTDDARWTPERVRQLAEAADHRATRRRRSRLVRAPALLVAGAAAATALVLAVPSLLPAPSGGGGLAASQDPAAAWRDATLAGLAPADVQALLPDAVPLGPLTDPSRPPDAPQDACGTAPLAGVAAPLSSETGQWGTSSTRKTEADGHTGTETTMTTTLEATVDTFADPAQAEAYARALNLSSRSCTPRTGEEQPVYPFVAEVFVAPALYVSGYHDGALEVTAVVTRDQYAATVHGWVPVPRAALQTLPPNQVPQPVPDADPQSLRAAVDDVVGLAMTAAQRAAGS